MGRPPLPPPPLLDPAWYPDPTGRYEARYWDGRKWTSHISHYGASGADPLLRARWDRWWLRGAFRLIMWAGIIALGWWVFDNYWPDDDRDLVADQQLATSAVLVSADLSDSGWAPSSSPTISPLTLVADSEGVVPVAACETLADDIVDSEDEPQRRQSFEADDGLVTIAHLTAIGGGTGFGRSYVESLREPEAGACLTALWEQATSGFATDLTVTSTMAMTDPSFGDEAVWWRLAGEASGGALPLDVFADVVIVRVDRVVTEYVFSGTSDAVGVDVQRDVIQVHTARVRELLAALDAEDDDTCSDEEPDCELETDGESDPTSTVDDGG